MTTLDVANLWIKRQGVMHRVVDVRV